MQTAVVCVFLCMALGMVKAAPPPWTMMAPQPCCTPKQMEFILGESMISASSGEPSQTQLSAQVAVDYTSKQMAVTQIGESDGEPFNMTVIANYTSQEVWFIDGLTDTCIKSKLPSPDMGGQCLSKDAKYMGTVTLGLGTTISGDSWMLGNEGEMVMIVSSDTCVPLMGYSMSKTSDELDFAGGLYFNIKDKITDPSVFNVPDICKQNGVPIVESFTTSPLVDYLLRKQQMK